MQAGRYVGEVMGDLPHDLVGMMGDWVKHKRARRWAELCADTEKILRDRGVDNREDISPSVAIPLIGAAINEDRDELRQRWAKLFAAAMDPARANLVRPAVIDLLKKMDPLDAVVLDAMNTPAVRNIPQGDSAERLLRHLRVDQFDAFFSVRAWSAQSVAQSNADSEYLFKGISFDQGRCRIISVEQRPASEPRGPGCRSA